MSLENEIGLKSFRNEWQKVGLSILYTHGYLFNTYENFFKEHGLTTQQYNVLRLLREQSPKPVSTSYIREKLLDKMADASRLVSRLSIKSLVDVTQNASDKRLVNILISEKGLRVLEAIDTRLHELDEKLSGVNEDEASTLVALLSKVRGPLKEAIKKETANVS